MVLLIPWMHDTRTLYCHSCFYVHNSTSCSCLKVCSERGCCCCFCYFCWLVCTEWVHIPPAGDVDDVLLSTHAGDNQQQTPPYAPVQSGSCSSSSSASLTSFSSDATASGFEEHLGFALSQWKMPQIIVLRADAACGRSCCCHDCCHLLYRSPSSSSSSCCLSSHFFPSCCRPRRW